MEFDSFVVIFIIKTMSSVGESKRGAAEGLPWSGPQLWRTVLRADGHSEPALIQLQCLYFDAKVKFQVCIALVPFNALEAISYLPFYFFFLKKSPPNSKNVYNSGSVPHKFWICPCKELTVKSQCKFPMKEGNFLESIWLNGGWINPQKVPRLLWEQERWVILGVVYVDHVNFKAILTHVWSVSIIPAWSVLYLLTISFQKNTLLTVPQILLFLSLGFHIHHLLPVLN